MDLSLTSSVVRSVCPCSVIVDCHIVSEVKELKDEKQLPLEQKHPGKSEEHSTVSHYWFLIHLIKGLLSQSSKDQSLRELILIIKDS